MWKLHRRLNFLNIFRLAAIFTWVPALKVIWFQKGLLTEQNKTSLCLCAMHIGAIWSPFQLIASWHIEILNLFLISLNSYYIDALKFIFFSELSNSVVFLQRKQSSNEGTEEGIDLQQRYPCLGSHIKLKNFAKGFHVHQCKKNQLVLPSI